MKLLLSLIFAASLGATSPEQKLALATAKLNASRLAQHQKLAAQALASQKKVDIFMMEWIAACAPRLPWNDGGCREAPPQPTPPTAPIKKVEPSNE